MVGNVAKSVTRKPGKARRSKGPRPDTLCMLAIQGSPNMLIPWYLMGAYAYQVLDETLISDHLYDALCVQLLERWDTLEHRHKGLIDHAALASGTSSYLNLAEHYPAILRDAVHLILSGEL